MGVEIRCKKCGHVLFEFDEIPHDILWYSKFRHNLGGKCPNCGHQLPDVSKYARKMRFEVESSIRILAK